MRADCQSGPEEIISRKTCLLCCLLQPLPETYTASCSAFRFIFQPLRQSVKFRWSVNAFSEINLDIPEILFIISVYKFYLSLSSELIFLLISDARIVILNGHIKLAGQSLDYSSTAWTAAAVKQKLGLTHFFSAATAGKKSAAASASAAYLRW